MCVCELCERKFVRGQSEGETMSVLFHDSFSIRFLYNVMSRARERRRIANEGN